MNKNTEYQNKHQQKLKADGIAYRKFKVHKDDYELLHQVAKDLLERRGEA